MVGLFTVVARTDLSTSYNFPITDNGVKGGPFFFVGLTLLQHNIVGSKYMQILCITLKSTTGVDFLHCLVLAFEKATYPVSQFWIAGATHSPSAVPGNLPSRIIPGQKHQAVTRSLPCFVFSPFQPLLFGRGGLAASDSIISFPVSAVWFVLHP